MADEELPIGLLETVKNYLDVTWTDPKTDGKLTGIIRRGIAYIDGIAGRAKDYMVEGAAQGLLLNYCRYERANAMEDFQKNYLHELIGLQVAEGVDMFAEAETESDV